MLYFTVLLGIDRLVADNFKPMKGMKIGLLSNIACCDSKLRPTISLFESTAKIYLKAIFAPEHGFYGALQDQVKARDSLYGRRVKIHSLYDIRRKPEPDALRSVDALAIDLIDIGARYYTFTWSAMLLIQEAARLGRKVFILDRPNPLNGVTVQGPLVESGYESFVGLYSIPIRHGMTIAELCIMLCRENGIGADIHVIKTTGWRRKHHADETHLIWTVPSPNMPHYSTALVYPGMCLLEGTNVSEGRGTTRPFETFGAPWIDSNQLTRALQKSNVSGANFRPAHFIPTFNKYCGELCGGVHIYVTNRKKFKPVLAGLELIRILIRLYPRKFQWRKPPYEFEKEKMPFDILVGNSWIRRALENGNTVAAIQKRWHTALENFKSLRRRYLYYS